MLDEDSRERTSSKPDAVPLFGPPDRLKRAAKHAFLVYLVVRAALFVVAVIAIGAVPMADAPGAIGRGSTVPEPGWHNLLTAWARWDANWYLHIAEEGYEAEGGTTAFFPLYPLVVRALTYLTFGNSLVAGLVVSNACLYASLVVLYLLTAREYDERTARRSIAYLAVFPTAVALFSPYTESLFLMLALLTLLAARQEQWVVAAAAGALAGLTRSVGFVLSAAIAVEAVHRYWRRPDRLRRLGASLPWSLGPLVGLATWLLAWQIAAGDFRIPIEAQEGWERKPTFPLVTLFLATRMAFQFVGVPGGGLFLLDWIITMPAIAAAVWLVFRTRPLYGVYVWASLLVGLSLVWEPRPLMSMPRFLLPIFPLTWAPALLARGRPGLHVATVASSASLAALVTALYVAWHFVF